MAQFKPIGKKSVSQEIIDQIMTLMNSGELKPGDKLPSERALCEQFKVSRSSVREAIVTLESMGIVERKSRMSVLSSNKSKLDSGFLTDLSATFSNINDVLEARSILEGEIILLAVERATPEDISKIAGFIKTTDDIKEFQRIDQCFHIAIAEAAHNPVICSIYKLMLDYLFSTHNIYEAVEMNNSGYTENTIKGGLESHRQLLAAIASGDKKMARMALEQHLGSAKKSLLSSVGAITVNDKNKT